MQIEEFDASSPRWAAVVRALAAGPALACAGYLGAVLTTGSPGPAPFTPEFHDKYDGLWLIPGTIGFVLGLVKLIMQLRADSKRRS